MSLQNIPFSVNSIFLLTCRIDIKNMNGVKSAIDLKIFL